MNAFEITDKTGAELLRHVVQIIKDEPKRLFMNEGVVKSNNWAAKYKIIDFPPCNTVACIAGWMAISKGMENYENAGWFEIGYFASNQLGIPYDVARSLFYISRWPSKFEVGFLMAKNAEERAKVLEERVEHWILFEE